MEKGIEPKYPEIEFGFHVIDYLFELGPVTYTGDGISPVSFTEIANWALLTRTPVSSWEAKALRGLSTAFVRQSVAAKDPKCPSPWEPERVDREIVSSGVEDLFRALKKRQEREK